MKTQRDYFVLLAGVLVGILLIGGSATAQVWEEWVARYNGQGNSTDHATAIAADVQGNVFVTGWSASIGAGYDFVTIKYNSNGEEVWISRYDGPAHGDDFAYALILDLQGNVLVTGESQGPSTGADYTTIKYATNGQELWIARYDASHGSDVSRAITSDGYGNIYVTGASVALDADFATIKYDSAGAAQWIARYSPFVSSEDIGLAIAVDSDENVYVTGNGMPQITPNAATIKYDRDGVLLWARLFYGDSYYGYAFAHEIELDSTGNAVVALTAGNSLTYLDYATIKYNSLGDTLWIATYDAYDDDMASSLELDHDGNVYVSGSSDGLGASLDFCTVKYDASGVEQWVARTDGPGHYEDVAFASVLDGFGNCWVAGYTRPGGQYYDCATIKVDQAGQSIWGSRYNGPGNLDDVASAICVDSASNIIITGYSAANGFPAPNEDYVTIKHTQTCPINITITPISSPIIIPPSGGSFDFNVQITNSAPSSQTFDAWISVQLPGGSWYGPVLGPVNLTLPGQGALTRVRTQNVPGSAPAGTYTYRGYVGGYPAKWDSSSFTFEKMGSGIQGSGFGEWANTGESLGDEKNAFRTYNLELRTSVSPNPFNPRTVLSYQLPVASYVNLTVCDISGRRIETVANGWREAGSHEAAFDGSNLASGIYVYRLEAGDFSAVKKMVLMK